MRLSHDRWYSRDGQRQLQGRAYSKSSAFRKVIALSLLLAMVVVVMTQLSDPTQYEPAFSAIGLTQTSQTSRPMGTEPALTPTKDAEFPAVLNLDSPSAEFDRVTQVWLKLLQDAKPETLTKLAVDEFGEAVEARNESRVSNPNEAVSAPTPSDNRQPFVTWLEQTEARLSEWPEASEKNANGETSETSFHRNFVEQWRAWASLHRRNIQSASSALDADVRDGLRLALDLSLLRIIKDAEPWRPTERWTLARTLQRAQGIREYTSARQATLEKSQLLRVGSAVEIQLLLKQTSELRGKVIRFRGAPATNPEASQVNSDGLKASEYEVVWFKPEGTNPQPICVYQLKEAAPRNGWPKIRPPDSKASPPDQGVLADETPMVEVTGILIKRLAYPSQRGIDVAPVLVGIDAQWVKDVESASMVLSQSPSADARFPVWLEPGEQENELKLLREILASDLESLRDETILTPLLKPIEQKSSVDPQRNPEELEAFKFLSQIMGRLPRIDASLRRVLVSRAEIGPAKPGQLSGWARKIDSMELPNTRDTEGRPIRLYRLAIDNNMQSPPVLAFVNQVPLEWRGLSEIDQPVALSGLHVQFGDEEDSPQFWIADHPSWSWDWSKEAITSADNLSPPIDSSWMRLGAAGFDLGSAEMIHKLSKQSLVAAEAEVFYSLIDATDRIAQLNASEQADTTPPKQTAFDCLDNSLSRTLRLTNAKVHVVRVTKIEVANEASQVALQGSHYFELDGLVDIKGHAVRLKSPDGKINIDFEAEYPITLVAKRLPAWLFEGERILPEVGSEVEELRESENRPQSESESVWYPRKTIDIDGYFYRLWSYTTSQTRNATQQTGSPQPRFLQNGPLIAVSFWSAHQETPLVSDKRSVFREIMLGIGLGAICLYFLYRLQTSNRRKTRRKAA